MKNQNKIIIETVIIFISVILALYIWRFISLPFKGIDIIGEYQSRSYHSLNDVIRYFIFIFLWLRATLPRYRYDQIMRLGWKVFLPITFFWLTVIGILIYLKYLPL